MKYCWGIAVVLSSGIVAGCSGGTTTTDDAGTDAFVFPHDAPHDSFIAHDSNVQVGDALLDAFRAADVGADTNVSVDANVDGGSDGGSDGGHDASADGGHDANMTTTPDGGCAVIDGEIFAAAACGPGLPACPMGFTCHPDPGIIPSASCRILCSGIGDHCPCSSACSHHDAAEAVPEYWSCDEL
jgi:hypothetical protein